MSILCATINHNLPSLTSNVVATLRADNSVEKEIMVLDNGSEEKYEEATHKVHTNLYFGGAVNYIFEYFLTTKHDHLFILNNDLIFHPYNMLKTMVVLGRDYDLFSPSITNASQSQCHWRQMHCWYSGTRDVKWIDFQAPLFKRSLVEKIRQYPSELFLGWGLDFYSGLMMQKWGLKTGVTDDVNFTHLEGQTIKRGKLKSMGANQFFENAETNMYGYFQSSGMTKEYEELRHWGRTYKI